MAAGGHLPLHVSALPHPLRGAAARKSAAIVLLKALSPHCPMRRWMTSGGSSDPLSQGVKQTFLKRNIINIDISTMDSTTATVCVCITLISRSHEDVALRD